LGLTPDFLKGRGFAGHMKRHGFSGGRASHGKNSVMRKAGSVGAGTSPGRIFQGMKMAGRMGNDKVTIKNLQILDIDYNNNLIFVKGSIPGSRNNYIYLRKN
jgi:large subunit ribosomal protein L3